MAAAAGRASSLRIYVYLPRELAGWIVSAHAFALATIGGSLAHFDQKTLSRWQIEAM
jgi:hypothetical protein